jgi:hypothetical protein
MTLIANKSLILLRIKIVSIVVYVFYQIQHLSTHAVRHNYNVLVLCMYRSRLKMLMKVKAKPFINFQKHSPQLSEVRTQDDSHFVFVYHRRVI